MKAILRPLAIAVAVGCCAFLPPTAFAASMLTQAQDRLFVMPGFDAVAYRIRFNGPDGFIGEQTWLPEERITLTAPKSGWTNGDYRVEIWPILAVEHDATKLAPNARAPWAPVEATFTAHDGALYLADASLPSNEHDTYSKDRLIPDDLIVRGSTCIGLDCSANDNFGFDTLRLRENNTRLKFEDTSLDVGFAANDWELLANESGTGGANKFSIRDVTGNKTPFTVLAGAPDNALVVGSNGNIGLGTSTPSAKLHVTGSLTTTGAPTFETNAGFIGKAGAGLGGNWRYVDDTGAPRWLAGILGTAGATAFSVYNIATSTEAMRIDSAGKASFGAGINSTPIGAAAPSTGAFTTLTAAGTATEFSPAATIIDWASPNARITAGSGGGNHRNLVLRASNAGTPNADQLHLSYNGNVGIGTTPSSEKLYVNGGRLRVASGTAPWALFSAGASSASFMGFLTAGGSTAGYIGTDGGAITSSGTGTGFGIRAESDLILMSGAAESMRLQANGNVGIGSYSGNNHRLFVYHNSSDAAAVTVRQDGAGDLARFQGASGAERMRLTSAGNLGIGTNAPTEKLEVNGNIKATGNITITGTLSQGSDRNSKENFAAVDPQLVLDKIEDMDVTRWNYIADGEAVQHIGPMAQDFYAAFGLGESDTKIAPLDTSGIALVAIKGLQQELDEVRGELKDRDAEIAALNAKLDRLNALVAELAVERGGAAVSVSAEAPQRQKSAARGL